MSAKPAGSGAAGQREPLVQRLSRPRLLRTTPVAVLLGLFALIGNILPALLGITLPLAVVAAVGSGLLWWRARPYGGQPARDALAGTVLAGIGTGLAVMWLFLAP